MYWFVINQQTKTFLNFYLLKGLDFRIFQDLVETVAETNFVQPKPVVTYFRY